MKPYQKIPIQECGEALVAIPLEHFSVVSPHPYEKLGAPYGQFSPYFLRQTVADKLLQAQIGLQACKPNWRLQIFDAYRPVSVQQFMVDYTFVQVAEAEGLDPENLGEVERSRIQTQVLNFWAVPSPNPDTPPPHSTGAAVDLTLVDGDGQMVDMGSKIDEISPQSYPNHFASSSESSAQHYHQNRQLLHSVMSAAGFFQHPNEWWHFSFGDQLWAYQKGNGAIARYGTARPSHVSTKGMQPDLSLA